MSAPKLWSLWELMQQFEANPVVANACFLGSVGTAWRKSPPRLSPDAMAEFIGRFSNLVGGLSKIDAPISLAAAQELLRLFEASSPEPDGNHVFVDQKLGSVLGQIDKIVNVIGDELGNLLLVQLSTKHRDLFDQQFGLFGQSVDDKFPEAIGDISEAGKCLALRRYTACVFHLMRAMESGVAVLAESLGATMDDKNGQRLPWGILTANIGSKIEALPKGDKRDGWLGVHALLYAANRAYRTKTAHPKKTYDEDEATAAFHATKSFMQEMAGIIS